MTFLCLNHSYNKRNQKTKHSLHQQFCISRKSTIKWGKLKFYNKTKILFFYDIPKDSAVSGFVFWKYRKEKGAINPKFNGASLLYTSKHLWGGWDERPPVDDFLARRQAGLVVWLQAAARRALDPGGARRLLQVVAPLEQKLMQIYSLKKWDFSPCPGLPQESSYGSWEMFSPWIQFMQD